MKTITGRLAEKAGKWYAVINLYTPEGKRKEKWMGLNLEAKKGSKTEANARLSEILAEFNSGKAYLQGIQRERTRAARESAGGARKKAGEAGEGTGLLLPGCQGQKGILV